MNPNRPDPTPLPEDQIPVAAGYFRPANLPRPSPQTEGLIWDTVTELPRWARVAIAARCARRAYPLTREEVLLPDEVPSQHLPFDHTPKSRAEIDLLLNTEHLDSGALAILIAEAFAERGKVDSGLADWPLFAAERAQRLGGNSAAAAAAMAAHVAAHRAGDSPTVARYASEALQNAARSIMSENWGEAMRVPADEIAYSLSAEVKDLNLLRRKAREEHWTDDTPVSPAVFGPMWPSGIPSWWKRPEEIGNAQLKQANKPSDALT